MEKETPTEEPSVSVETKEAKKRQEKDRKKGGKKAESFMKSIANLTPEEKIEALSKKNTESIDEIRGYKSSVQVLQRKICVLEKEKEQLQNDQSKGLLARSRLETLCRELQRQNKSIKDESLQKIREEEEKRKEVSHRFQTALNEVSSMMQQNTDKNLKLRDDNIEISNKFQKLCEEFKSREEEVIRLTRQLDLEKQLAEATLKRTECQLNAEREIWSKEKEHYMAQLNLNAEEKKSLETNIKGLEEHLSMYSTKYDEFENTISKSNQVFDSYKVEMHRMSKHMSKFEQECNVWKERWLQSQQTINRITSEHRACEQNIQERDKKVKNLSDLCRSIQDERSAYIKQLKEEGLTPVVVVHEPKQNVNVPKQNTNPSRSNSHAKTKKEKALALLKKEMQVIETQLADTLTSIHLNEATATNLESQPKSNTDEESDIKDTVVADINKSIEEITKKLKESPSSSVITDSENTDEAANSINESEKLIDEPAKLIEEPEKSFEELEKLIEGPEKSIEEPEKSIEEPEKSIEVPEKLIEESEKSIEESEKSIEEPEKLITELEKLITEPEKIILEPEKLILESEKSLEESEKLISEPEKIIIETEKLITEPDKLFMESEKSLKESEKIIIETKKLITEPEKITKGQQKSMKKQEKLIKKSEKLIKEPEKLITKRESSTRKPEKTIKEKNPPLLHDNKK